MSRKQPNNQKSTSKGEYSSDSEDVVHMKSTGKAHYVSSSDDETSNKLKGAYKTPDKEVYIPGYKHLKKSKKPSEKQEAGDALSSEDEDPNMPPQIINILLLGETGVGKSTLLNAVANYLTYSSLPEAIASDEIISLIPCRFTITNDSFEETLVTFGEDENESQIAGASATQSVKSYRFNLGKVIVRFIDTPGVGDTRGITKDDENLENLLAAIGELTDIHGICILLKPNNARLTVLFEYCIKELLSRLQRSASNNIIFLFTNSRSTFYRPGDTTTSLKAILKQIYDSPPHVEIPYNKDNTFCMDNEAFRFLLAKKKGLNFSQREENEFASSWQQSATVCKELIDYVRNITPHKIQDTVSVNEARRLIVKLSVPLAEVADVINVNLIKLEKHKRDLADNTQEISQQKTLLYIPVVNLKIEQLNQPRTVCTDKSCTEHIKVNDVGQIFYKQICHNPCYLIRTPKEVIGSPELKKCWAMSNDICHQCHHSYKFHMHIYYVATKYDDQIVDANVEKNIKKREDMSAEVQKHILLLEVRQRVYENEREYIQKSMAKFCHFLKHNAITPYNDKYSEYLRYLISTQELLGDDGDKVLINSYNKLISVYEQEIAVLEKHLVDAKQNDAKINTVVTADDIVKTVNQLYKLKLTGPTIRNYYVVQENASKSELLTTEKEYKANNSLYKKFKNFVKNNINR